MPPVLVTIDCTFSDTCEHNFAFLLRSTELDSNWNWFQLRCMQVGGNANAVSQRKHSWIGIHLKKILLGWSCPTRTLWWLTFCFRLKTAFFRQHGCTTNDTNAKYNSRAAQMYREKIRQQANAALSKYGTDVSINAVDTINRINHCMVHTAWKVFLVRTRGIVFFGYTDVCFVSKDELEAVPVIVQHCYRDFPMYRSYLTSL